MENNKKVYLFCGVESTGKSTSIEIIKKYLEDKGLRVKIVSEVGRDISVNSGGVDSMSLSDYEQILFAHQTNFLKAFVEENDVILLDTDSTYTRYYLEKDLELLNSNPKLSKKLIKLSEDIVKINLSCNRIDKLFYLNSDCPFVQDGTRTYEQTRKQDDKTLFNLYNSAYKNKIQIIYGENYDNRLKQITTSTEKETDKEIYTNLV